MSSTAPGTRVTGLEIAVVGMAGRFPKAGSVDALWEKLVRGEECISFFTDEEVLASGVDPAAVADPTFVKAAGVVDGADLFDAGFFNCSPREAALLDPQQRLFLETAWAALEHAGYAPGTFRGAVGVYGGVGLNDYLRRNVPGGRSGGLDHQAAVANDKDFLTTRVSYKLNLEGPSLVVQTACSTSLVAIHLASQALIAGECDMALAGGVTIRLPQKAGYFFQAEGMSSPDGHCRAFSAQAQGCLPGNGGAIVVLKRLSDALQDRDCIHAIIKGSALNNDGAMKVGYTAPRADGQARVIRSALQIAEVDAGTIGYLEAHGTGTALGDPIEIQAATQAFRQDTDRTQYCAIGAIKSTLGHMDAAAGVAGFIKAALAVKHGLIPASLHCEETNPKIDFQGSPFFVNTTLRTWEQAGAPRRAGVSSFGVGGTNAHVVLEEPPPTASTPRQSHELLIVSAKTSAALEQAVSDLAAYLRDHSESNLADVAFTLRNGRSAFRHRRSVVCSGVDDAVAQLSTPSTASAADGARLAFMFPGQGSQYPGMCRGLYETEPEFRRQIDRAASILKPLAGFDLREVVCAPDESAEIAEFLRNTRIAQPAIFSVSYALSQLLLSCGLKPSSMIGHSVGEYVAACIAGVFSFEDALWLVAERARLMATVAPGAMLAVPLAADEVTPLLPHDLAIAVLNAPRASVVSGPCDSVRAFAENLQRQGVETRALHTSHAFHSPMMEPVLDAFVACVKQISLQPPSIPFVSNVTGTWITAEQATAPDYWARQLRQTVRFSEGLDEILAGDGKVLVEVGPGQSLTSLARRHRGPKGSAPLALASTRHADGREPDRAVFLGALGGVWASGHEVDWRQVDASADARRVPLPTYPFQRERHWIDPVDSVSTHANTGKRENLRDWFSVPTWERLPPSLARLPAGPLTSERWIVFADGLGLGEEIGDRLAVLGHDVVTVRTGNRFGQTSERSFSIDPGRQEDYERLCSALAAPRCSSLRIIHCWTAEPEGAAQDRGFFSLLFLTQALARQEWLTSCRLTVVSTDVHAVIGNERLQPEKATVVAFCRTLSLEYPEFHCTHLDVVMPASPAAQRPIVEGILASLDEPGGESIAMRGPYRWRQTLVPVALDPPDGVAVLKEEGVYLITGGMAGVGLAVAEHLAKTVHARLVLVGRTPPRRDAWPDRSVADDAVAGLAVLERTLSERPGRSTISSQPGLESTLDRLCAAYAMAFLRNSGVDPARSGAVSRDELAARCRVLPQFDRLFACILRVLVEEGLVTLTGSDVRFTDPAGEWPDVQRLRADAIAQYPRMTPVFDLLDTCAGNYHLALTGDVPALGLLFGDGAEVFERAVANIRDHSDIPLCQTLVRDLLSRLLDGDRAGTLRVLEIGGGEGLLTRDLLPLCDGRDVEYHFTDIGRAFVLGAERDARSRGLNFARFDMLDISRAPEQQGFAAGTYDVVFAFNVLHATRSVAESLANAKSLLAPGGLLVLQESIRPARWVDFVWGLTDGWWTFEDTPLRQTSPLMGLDSWVESLRGAGFESVASFPQSGNRRVSSDAGVVIARRPSNASGDAHRLSSIEKLKEMGAQVEVVTADVADRAQMQVALDRALARFGRIDGVVHSALVLDDATIQSKTRESAERVLAPKIAGTRVLEELCTGLDLDFFVMFSSLVSLLGGAGQIDYCAASNFQDAFAHATQSKLAKSVISIDWGAWREVGKAFRSAVERGIPSHEALPDGMSPSEGLDAFMRVLASPFPQVLVSPVDPCVLMKRRAVSAAGRPAASRRPAEPAEVAEAPRNETEQVIADIWRDVLGVDRIGVEDNFFDLGGDSVISLQFIAKAKKAGLRFTNRQVFEHQTIAGLAAVAAESAGHALSKEVGS